MPPIWPSSLRSGVIRRRRRKCWRRWRICASRLTSGSRPTGERSASPTHWRRETTKGGVILRGAPPHDHKEESMGETITMADVLYVPVDDQGEPPRFQWDPEDGGGVSVSVFGDFWHARQSPEGKGRSIRRSSDPKRTCRNS